MYDNYTSNGATSPAKQKFVASAASRAYQGPSVVDFLNLSGYDSSPASRTALAGEYGIKGYNTGANNGDMNTALLAALRGGSPAGGSSNMGPTQVAGASTPTPGTQSTTGTGSTPDAARTAFDTYLNSLSVDKTSDAKARYADFIANRDRGISDLSGRGLGIPLTLVRGQQAKLMEQSDIEGRRLQNNIQIAQDEQDQTNAKNKARYDFETAMLSRQDALDKEKREANKPFELSEGQTRFERDPVTGEVRPVASVKKTFSPSSSSSGSIKSGKLTYTAQDKSDDSQALEQSRGSDGWVDPSIYQKLANAWTTNGGNIDDFLKEYPPKLFVNPANDWLPPYLRNTTKQSGDDLSWLNQ